MRLVRRIGGSPRGRRRCPRRRIFCAQAEDPHAALRPAWSGRASAATLCRFENRATGLGVGGSRGSGRGLHRLLREAARRDCADIDATDDAVHGVRRDAFSTAITAIASCRCMCSPATTCGLSAAGRYRPAGLRLKPRASGQTATCERQHECGHRQPGSPSLTLGPSPPDRHGPKGANPRFVVTNLAGDGRDLYAPLLRRGEPHPTSARSRASPARHRPAAACCGLSTPTNFVNVRFHLSQQVPPGRRPAETRITPMPVGPTPVTQPATPDRARNRRKSPETDRQRHTGGKISGTKPLTPAPTPEKHA